MIYPSFMLLAKSFVPADFGGFSAIDIFDIYEVDSFPAKINELMVVVGLNGDEEDAGEKVEISIGKNHNKVMEISVTYSYKKDEIYLANIQFQNMLVNEPGTYYIELSRRKQRILRYPISFRLGGELDA